MSLAFQLDMYFLKAVSSILILCVNDVQAQTQGTAMNEYRL
jgi:hypothetical protein